MTDGGGSTPAARSDVARGVVNLGNTCYMNVVLQALSHAPELCLAIDCEPHRVHCPIAREGSLGKRKLGDASVSDGDGGGDDDKISEAKSVSSVSKLATSKKGEKAKEAFCVLCELEKHVDRAHSTASGPSSKCGGTLPQAAPEISASSSDAITPRSFVDGFVSHVAPWFKIGNQEDSHEFLRLLIDGMQKCCPPSSPKESEYPFSLFRGMLESKVTCSGCGAVSCTTDPMEDLGLDIEGEANNNALPDIKAALARLVKNEDLQHSGYRCESCHRVGQATKQTRLASIPPILTLHLKRFRYGGVPKRSPTASAAAHTSTSGTGTGRRGTRDVTSSSSAAFASLGSSFVRGAGKSGSAKIEGHIRFDNVLDLHDYCTPQMQALHKKFLYRLFAVVVHDGKNSHSGHYFAYVDFGKKGWRKMDDARVSRASFQEVAAAEAYMLFYRVTSEHPVTTKLKNAAKCREDEAAAASETSLSTGMEIEMSTAFGGSGETIDATTAEADKKPPAETAGRAENKELTAADTNPTARSDDSKPLAPKTASSTMAASAEKADESNHETKSKRRKRTLPPKYSSGAEWARRETRLTPAHILSVVDRLEECVSENVEFIPEYFRSIIEEASRRDAQVGKGPSDVSADDVLSQQSSILREGILECLHATAMATESFLHADEESMKQFVAKEAGQASSSTTQEAGASNSNGSSRDESNNKNSSSNGNGSGSGTSNGSTKFNVSVAENSENLL